MGWDLGDGVHEGWATCVSADGRLSHGSSSVGVMVEGITGAYPVHHLVPTWEVVPYAEVIGWRGGCACGWQGQLWERVPALELAEVGARRVYDARGDVPERVEEDIEAEWARHTEPAQAISAVAAAVGAARAATRDLDEAVAAESATVPDGYGKKATAGPWPSPQTSQRTHRSTATVTR